MFGAFFYSIRQAVRRATFSVGAALLMSVGLGFLTAAAWIFLAQTQGAMLAALIIGCAYFGLGMVALAVASIRRPVPAAGATRPQAPNAGSPGGIVGALMQGIGAGIAAGAAGKASQAAPSAPPDPHAAPPAAHRPPHPMAAE
ncbi:hypothetical protein [Pseudooceanicola aestuarii]|uniref:hypothetical protein n=1 Tax=Pseudooceanicola aestuarii TaxID=2697319 RepID=UPI0013D75D5A|nr:hypothetical protein [Pseudooceanicola aestuarii]